MSQECKNATINGAGQAGLWGIPVNSLEPSDSHMKRYSAFAVAREALRYHTGWERAWRSPEPKRHYDVIIVGAGGHGLATAYYHQCRDY
jgi:sarcosine oxidase subunit beta